MAASRLPRISINNEWLNVIGKNTKHSMHSGIYWGYISLIEGIVKRIKDESNQNYTVIATGGLSEIFSKNCNAIQVIDNDLTINGLIHLYQTNNKK